MCIILVVFAVIYELIRRWKIGGKSNDVWVFMGLGKSIISTMKYLY